MTSNSPLNAQAVADQVAAAFVHWLFPSMRTPAYLACPDDECADLCRTTIAKAAKKKRVKTEVVDLRPNPSARLNQVTAGLRDINDRTNDDKQPWPTLLILEGFDLLEGSKNDAPTFPFRSRFQFDREHLWLFMGQDLLGRTRIITPAGETWDSWFDGPGASADFMTKREQSARFDAPERSR